MGQDWNEGLGGRVGGGTTEAGPHSVMGMGSPWRPDCVEVGGGCISPPVRQWPSQCYWIDGRRVPASEMNHAGESGFEGKSGSGSGFGCVSLG